MINALKQIEIILKIHGVFQVLVMVVPGVIVVLIFLLLVDLEFVFVLFYSNLCLVVRGFVCLIIILLFEVFILEMVMILLYFGNCNGKLLK